MSFEPKNFFVGLVDFFSILMPGAVATYVGKDRILSLGALPIVLPEDPTQGVVLFLFVSYLLGHFVFLIGAAFLDDCVYDSLRSCTERGQIRRLADGKRMSWTCWRRIAGTKQLFGKKPDETVTCIERHKVRTLDAFGAAKAVNAYQWCKARLSKENPEGLATVQRFEADSKFFRSFSVLLSALLILCLCTRHFGWASVCFGLVLMSLWRYVEQRFKATQQAYWNIIALDAAKALAPSGSTRPPRGDGLSHAGGVVRQRVNRSFTYLLVTAKKNQNQWVLPKGHIEPGEEPEETAVREVLEETGLWAKVICRIDDIALTVDGNQHIVRFYVMEQVEEATRPSREDRKLRWVTLEEAQGEKIFPEIQQILEKASRTASEDANSAMKQGRDRK